MRETGIVRFRFKGDVKLASQRLSTARTLLGRMKAYLGQARGAKLWKFDDGTVIRTRFYGEVQIAEIDVTGVRGEEERGWFFLYLFCRSEITGASSKALGWKVDRVSNSMTPIPGMPFDLPDEPLYADNHAHNNEIAVCLPGELHVYEANPFTGRLTLVRTIEFAYDAANELRDDFYATQIPGKYVFYHEHSDTEAERAFNLFDTGAGTVEKIVYPDSLTPYSYARGTVGQSNHHPTLKLFYLQGRREVSSEERYELLEIYSYVNPADVPTKIAEWAWPIPDVVLLPNLSNPIVSHDGSQIMMTYTLGDRTGYIVTKLASDGITPLEHRLPAITYPAGIPASTTQYVTFPLGGGDVPLPGSDWSTSPWDGKWMLSDVNGTTPNLRNMPVRNGTLFYEEAPLYRPPSIQVPGATDIAMQTVQCFDDGSPNLFANYASNSIEFLRYQQSLPLIDGSRVIRSRGQFASFDGVSTWTYIYQPAISIQKPIYSGDTVLGFRQTKHVQLTNDYNYEQTRALWQLSRPNAMAIYEPKEGGRPLLHV